MRLYNLLLTIIVILLVLIVSGMSYKDALLSEIYYEEMVCTGIWPDHDNLKPDCGKPTKGQNQ